MPSKVIYEGSLITSMNKIITIMVKCTDSLYAPVFSIQLASLKLFLRGRCYYYPQVILGVTEI